MKMTYYIDLVIYATTEEVEEEEEVMEEEEVQEEGGGATEQEQKCEKGTKNMKDKLEEVSQNCTKVTKVHQLRENVLI
jgi:hypothetical protein